MAKAELEIRILSRIPSRYRGNREYMPEELSGLEEVSGTAPDDRQHVSIRVKNRYCSSSDLKAYVLASRPGLDMSTWSYTSDRNGGVVISVWSDTILVPKDIYEALATDHVETRTFELQELAFTVDLEEGEDEWLRDLLPAYLDMNLLRRMLAARRSWAIKSDGDVVADRVSECGRYGKPRSADVFGILCDVLVSKRKSTEAYLQILE